MENRRALILEDEILVAVDIEDSLQAVGFEVTALATCAAALQWLEGNRPDIAVIDHRLADGSCDEVARRLAGADVPFIVHSASLRSDATDPVFASGHWITKPSPVDRLVDLAQELAEHPAPSPGP